MLNFHLNLMNSFPYGSDPVDPLEAAVEDIEAKKKEWSEALTKLQLTIKEMLKNPEKINLGYCMLLLGNISDANVAYQASKTVEVSDAIAKEWHNFSQEFANLSNVKKYLPGETTFFPDDVNDKKGVRLDGVATDGNLLVTYLDSSGKPTGGSVEYDPCNKDGTLKSGVPFFDIGGKLNVGLNPNADPLAGGDAFKPTGDPGPVAFANKMINAAAKEAQNTLQGLDNFSADLRAKYGPILANEGVDVSSICSGLTDVIAAFAGSNNPTYTFLASTGEYQGVSSSTVDDCRNYLSNFNGAKNTLETTLNSTTSQSQIALNQAMGQYQSEMTTEGGILSNLVNFLKDINSNMKS
jgi:hypothetical protein